MASSPSPPPSTSAAVWAVANWREVNIHDDNDGNNEGNNDHNDDDAGAGAGAGEGDEGNARCQIDEPVTKEDDNDTNDDDDDENPDCALVFQMFGTEEDDANIYEDVLYEYSTDMHDYHNIHNITTEEEKEETVKTTRR